MKATLTIDKSRAATEAVALLPVEPTEQLLGLVQRVQRRASSAVDDLGHMAEKLLRGGHELMRQMPEKTAQAKAAATAPLFRRALTRFAWSESAVNAAAATSGVFRQMRSSACPRKIRPDADPDRSDAAANRVGHPAGAGFRGGPGDGC